MRVKISETVDVTDEQRAQIGDKLGKKQASRDECRDFIWRHGSDWAQLLNRAEEYQDDLIGDAAGSPVHLVQPATPEAPLLDDLI